MFRPDPLGATHLARAGRGMAVIAPPGYSPLKLVIKRAIDIGGALVFFVGFGFLYLGVALAVLISMGRPVHYWQPRLGRGGKPFHFFKFRSMVRDSDAALRKYLASNPAAQQEWDTYQKLRHDPRITRVGRIIRRTSLDELPQFWNVLRGDMSLVGPRPCMQHQRGLYGKHWSEYCAMRPGITGLWQVSGRNRLPYAKRVELDAQYVQNWSLWLDIKILARTVSTVLRKDGSR